MMMIDCNNCEKDYYCCKTLGTTLSKDEALKYKRKIVPLTENGLTLGYVFVLEKDRNGNCVYLKENKCIIYKNRPSVCRKFQCQI
jgi:Fe-S-cluster containining protein